jgi:hypothetical protein
VETHKMAKYHEITVFKYPIYKFEGTRALNLTNLVGHALECRSAYVCRCRGKLFLAFRYNGRNTFAATPQSGRRTKAHICGRSKVLNDFL